MSPPELQTVGRKIDQHRSCPRDTEKDRHREGTPLEDASRNRGGVSKSQMTSKIDSKSSEARQEAWNKFSLTAI